MGREESLLENSYSTANPLKPLRISKILKTKHQKFDSCLSLIHLARTEFLA